MVEAVSLRSTVMVSSGQVSCELEGEAVILGVDAGTYFGLNSVGSRIWSLIQQPISVQDLCHLLGEEYQVEPVRCEQEVLQLLADLARERLIDVRNTPGP